MMRKFFIPLVLLFPVCGAAIGTYRFIAGGWPTWKVVAAAVSIIVFLLSLRAPRS
jgi:membrane protein YdbS with pleckstrin-like domain